MKDDILNRLNEMDARLSALTATLNYIDKNIIFIMSCMNRLPHPEPIILHKDK
jgi:hypothetical protein